MRDFHPLRMFTPKRTRDGALRRPRPRSAGGMKHAELKQHSGSRCARVPHVHSAPVGRGDAPAGRPYLAGAEPNARFMASTHVRIRRSDLRMNLETLSPPMPTDQCEMDNVQSVPSRIVHFTLHIFHCALPVIASPGTCSRLQHVGDEVTQEIASEETDQSQRAGASVGREHGADGSGGGGSRPLGSLGLCEARSGIGRAAD